MKNSLFTAFSATALLAAGLASGTALAEVSADEAAKLGSELTPVGANPKGNADGTIPEWVGASAFNEEQKKLTPDTLEAVRQQIVAFGKKNPDLNQAVYLAC